MVPPIRCFTCGAITKASWFEEYENLKALGYPERDVLNIFGIKKQCCRMVVMTYVPTDRE